MEAQKSGYRPSLHLISQHYSSRPTIQYALQHESIPVFTNPAKQNVFDRLYQHSSIQKTNRESLKVEQSQAYVYSPRRVARPSSSPPIEEQLVHKDKQSKEHIMALRTKYLNEEMRGMRTVPEINETSKKIMEKVHRERLAGPIGGRQEVSQPPITEETHPVPETLPSQPPRTRRLPSPPVQTQPSPTRTLSHSETNMVRAMMLHGKLSITPSSARGHFGIPRASVPDRREDTEVVKRVTLQSLREEVMTRFKGLEPELPPDYFSLPFDSRSRVFIENRSLKLQQVREREEAKEIEECTFSPIFYTRIPHRSLNRSTSQLLHLSQERSPRSLSQSSAHRSGSAPRSRSYFEQYQRRLTIKSPPRA